MDTGALLAALALAVEAVLLVLLVVLLRRRRDASDAPALGLLQQQLDALRQETSAALGSNTQTINQRLAELDRKMQDTTGIIGQRLDAANRVVQQVSTSLGELSEATKRVHEVGKDISRLEDILRAPKLRGIVGEYFLGDLLKQVVPNNYELQHRFQSGEAVDAVVRLSQRLVPIDAKFPLEDFQRLAAESDDEKRGPLRRRFVAAIRKHVEDIARKYILPDEGTFDFALMYIPAENVYYETIIKDSPDDTSISDLALARRVIPVSPNNLYAYLQSIVLGLKGLKIEQRAEEIMRHLGRLHQEYQRFYEEFDKLGTHLKNAQNKYEEAVKRLSRFEGKLTMGSGLEALDSTPAEPSGRNQ